MYLRLVLQFYTYCDQYSNLKVKVLDTQSCLTPCDLMDCSPLDSSIHRIFQAIILEWLPFISPGDPDPCLLCLLLWKTDSLPLCHLGSP